MTREHGLMMTGPNVLAILEKRKLQTRRVCTANNSMIDGGPTGKALWSLLRWEPVPDVLPKGPHVDKGPSPAGNPGPYWKVPMAPHPDDPQDNTDWWTVNRVYPRIQVGDIIYIKETWQAHPGVIKASAGMKTSPGRVDYKADESPAACPQRWRSAMMMPRWASRISMVVTEIKAERVRDISEEDSRAEGVIATRPLYGDPGGHAHEGHKDAFIDLWDSINGKTEGKTWADNPPVWGYCWEEIGT